MRSLHIRETYLGADHSATASSLFGLAALHDSIQRYSEARSLIQRTIQIYEKTLGNNHLHTQTAYSWFQKIELAFCYLHVSIAPATRFRIFICLE